MYKSVINKMIDIDISSIDNWTSSFFDYIGEDGLLLPQSPDTPDFIGNIALEFSDFIMETEYKPLGLKELKRFIVEVLELTDENALDEINKAKKDKLLQVLEFAYHKAPDRFKENVSFRDFFDMVSSQLNYSKFPFTATILGKYIDESKRIILYTNAIERSSSELRAVLSHELLHAAHYDLGKYDTAREIHRTDYLARIVKESLASYFEYCYCTDNGIPSRVNESWNISVTCYPYSGAKYIRDWVHFEEIYEEATNSIEKAIEILFEDNPSILYLIRAMCRFVGGVTISSKRSSSSKGKSKKPSSFATSFNSMGTGWFILRCYLECVDPSFDFWRLDKSINSLYIRERTYKEHFHKKPKAIKKALEEIKATKNPRFSFATYKTSDLLLLIDEILKVI